jgi:hypothetical protein
MTTQFGPVREVMFAPVSNPTDVNSFLIRDDAYAKSSAVLGRSLRLGDPIDTGVVSAAYQTSWAGGRDQNHFNDTVMYQDGDLDTTDSSGRIRFWPSLTPINRGLTETTVSIIPSPVANTATLNEVLITNTNGQVLRYRPDDGNQSVLANYSPLVPTKTIALDQTGGHSANWIATGFTNGDLRIFETVAGTAENRSYTLSPGYDAAKVAPIRDIVIHNRKLLVMMGYRLWQANFSGTTPVTWTEVISFNKGSGGAAKMVVVNNTLYILIEEKGGQSALYSSDGVTGAVLIQTFDNSVPVNLLSHKGGLYIHVNEYAYDEYNEAYLVSVLYRYSSSGIVKIYSRADNSQYYVDHSSNGPSCTWGDYVAISFKSLPRVMARGPWNEFTGKSEGDTTVGVMLYDPVQDAFHCGPTASFAVPAGTYMPGGPPDVSITAMGAAFGSLYMSLTDGVKRVVVATRTDRRVTGHGWNAGSSDIDAYYTAASQNRQIISSAFDANLPDQNKTWLRVNVKHNLNEIYKGNPYVDSPAADTRPFMNVYVTTSIEKYAAERVLIGTYQIPPPSGGYFPAVYISSEESWVTSTFNIPAGIKSTQLKYIIELGWYKTWPNFVDIDSAIIESVSVEYMLVASPKKVWRTRVLAENAQSKLSGAANTLTTRTAAVNKLFQYWTDGTPLYYWDASASPVTPTFASGVPTNHSAIVMVTDIGENSYRVDDRGSEVNSEVSLTMYEVS